MNRLQLGSPPSWPCLWLLDTFRPISAPVKSKVRQIVRLSDWAPNSQQPTSAPIEQAMPIPSDGRFPILRWCQETSGQQILSEFAHFGTSRSQEPAKICKARPVTCEGLCEAVWKLSAVAPFTLEAVKGWKSI